MCAICASFGFGAVWLHAAPAAAEAIAVAMNRCLNFMTCSILQRGHAPQFDAPAAETFPGTFLVVQHPTCDRRRRRAMREGSGQAAAAKPRADATELSEPELVALARQGLAGAFQEIMRRNNRRLFRAARGVLRDDAEAEDVVQEAYLRAFQALPAFRGDASLSTWLTRIVYNEAVGRLRRRRTATAALQADPAAPDGEGARILMFPTHNPGWDPESAAANRELRHVLEQAIDTLPGRF